MPTPPSFVTDIRPLFRDSDRRSMRFLFDLWDFDDAKENASGILAALADGSMPCDDSWPDEQVGRLRAWIDGGCQP